MPEDIETTSHILKFGEFTIYGEDFNNPEPHYKQYSGWKFRDTGDPLTLSDTVGINNVEFVAVYGRSEARTYTVNWYDYDRTTVLHTA